ncbi:NADPH-dependent FMN reductase [Candidatus Marsarchaeota G2 archaeon ECH_B_2]|uniref:NADPH-dependent FMN reductase n=3 Tax=Candidatus Marsarchaeota group 2 TaxID=2203771 RepID=A0A2R6B4C5_9ARCH|nr:MAG: NADPH-dependent FMN reductase [Candidatus Marsarchaeota G2 archaeon ECH_B_2]PSN97826.1 MAG: NADPH-dependent FMN reductase [Candidatus Marsarchaeota G2 archaeon ECH_B_3]PSN99219.1 MAG: NADPH-dependent FMN reductase [Candidatus Marsarchaeota G2 archaeon ECH_B_1]
MDEKIRVLGFAGSLRKASYNKMLLNEAVRLAPPNVVIETFDLEGIPLYNQDFEVDPPERVKEFKSKIRQSDALLIVTPEYNYSVPGVLKNAIDWASRPYGDNAFDGKPVAIMSASIGMLGGARAQYHLRQMCVFLNMYPVNTPEVFVTFAPQKFDSRGRLTDKDAEKFIRQLLENLANYTLRLKLGRQRLLVAENS